MITCQECNKEFNSIHWTHLKYKCAGTIRTLKDYKTKYPGVETETEETRTSKKQTEANYIKRYGVEEGSKLWNSYVGKHRDKNKPEALKARFGWDDDKVKAYNKSRSTTLENLVCRYGEEAGAEKWNNYISKQRYAGCKLEYFQEKYGIDEGQERYLALNKLKGRTLENYIRKHGEDLGTIKYHKIIGQTQANYISLSGSQFVKDVVQKLDNNYIFHDGVYSKEFCIYDKRPFMYDFVITSPVKAVIEFNGDFWHANPSKYKADEIVKHRGKQRLAKEIWEADEHKLSLIKARGFDIMVIWESEYLNNRQACIEKVIKWIQSLNK
jgi:very-short-patch-repair endonuclease